MKGLFDGRQVKLDSQPTRTREIIVNYHYSI